MLPLPLSKPLTTDELPARLFEIISQEHGKVAAVAASSVCDALGDLRAVIWQTATTLEIREELLVYLSTLNFLETVVNIKEQRWLRALDLDRVQALFYLGLCDASIGGEEFKRRDKSYPALKKSTSRFAKSAASFKLAKALLISQDNTTDVMMSAACFDCYQHLMLGNCYYTRYLESASSDDDNEETCFMNARYAAGAALQYQNVANETAELEEDIQIGIGASAKALAGYVSTIAEMWQAKKCEISKNPVEFMSRLRNARTALDGAYVDTSRLIELEPVKRELLDNVAVLDGELFSMQSSAEVIYSGVEVNRNSKSIEPHTEELFDIEDIINCTPVDSTVESLALACLPNGSQHEPTRERMIMEFESDSSFDQGDGIWMLPPLQGGVVDRNYSGTRNEYPNSHIMDRGTQDTILHLGNPFLDAEEGGRTIQIDKRTMKFITVLTVFVFLRIVLL